MKEYQTATAILSVIDGPLKGVDVVSRIVEQYGDLIDYKWSGALLKTLPELVAAGELIEIVYATGGYINIAKSLYFPGWMCVKINKP